MKAHVLYLCALSSAVIYSADARSFLYSNSLGDTSLLIETNQTFESESQAALFLEAPASISNYQKVAKVFFITNKTDQEFGSLENKGMEFDDHTEQQCKGEEYKYDSSNCSNGILADVCLYNSSYFKECCDTSYAYTSENCSLLNTTSSCGNKYKCDCTPELYPVTMGSCASPQVPAAGSGKSCTVNGQVRYTECVCPEIYSEICTGVHQQGKGVGCSKNGKTKYISCECESGYTLTCSQNGASPSNPSDYCLNGGVKYYNNCKTCPDNCSLDSCPNGVVCEKEACSGKYCDIGCDITKGYQNLDNYWCDGALRCLVK